MSPARSQLYATWSTQDIPTPTFRSHCIRVRMDIVFEDTHATSIDSEGESERAARSGAGPRLEPASAFFSARDGVKREDSAQPWPCDRGVVAAFRPHDSRW